MDCNRDRRPFQRERHVEGGFYSLLATESAILSIILGFLTCILQFQSSFSHIFAYTYLKSPRYLHILHSQSSQFRRYLKNSNMRPLSLNPDHTAWQERVERERTRTKDFYRYCLPSTAGTLFTLPSPSPDRPYFPIRQLPMFRTLSATWSDPFHPRRNVPRSFRARAFGIRLQELDRTKAAPGKFTRSANFSIGKGKEKIELEV